MKWKTQHQNEFKWHKWFAWYPVRVPLYPAYSDPDIYKYEWVWLEEVERKYEFISWQGDGDWWYRHLQTQQLKDN